MRKILHSLVLCFICSSPVLAGAEFRESVVTVEVRPGVTQRYLQVVPKKPVAATILFAGYGGYLAIGDQGIGQPSSNFLVRSRELFARHGVVAAVVDVPSDHYDIDGILGWRDTPEHAADIGKIIARLRRDFGLPVWLVGTSRGTISAANAAARLQQGSADGLVLTASVTEPSRRNPGNLYDVRLKDIRIPTLVVHHEKDACHVTPYSGAKRLIKKLRNVQKKEFIGVSGGTPSYSNACGAESEHGFLGIEEEVVRSITDWIKANSPTAK